MYSVGFAAQHSEQQAGSERSVSVWYRTAVQAHH